MITGVFPAPTPIAGLPDEYAALTIPGPPVANIKSALSISSLDAATLGSSIQPIIFSGAPYSTAVSSAILAVSIVHFLALGCGENIIAFLVFNASNILNAAVEVGFVVGITPAISPIGVAIFLIPYDLSSSSTPHVLASLYLL